MKFLLQVVRADGGRVHLRPGGRGETELVQAVAARVVSKGVGVFRTESQVRAKVEEAIREVLFELKSDVQP